MTFTEAQQKKHRAAFIEDCRQKAWSAACHADWISKGIDEMLVDYRKFQEEDATLEADIKELANALDYHSVENREKRKGMQERRTQLAQNMQIVGKAAQEGQKAMQQLLQSVESALALAKHAEAWSWKEVEAKPEKSAPQTYRFTKDWSDRKAGDIMTADELGDGAIFKDLLADGTIEKV